MILDPPPSCPEPVAPDEAALPSLPVPRSPQAGDWAPWMSALAANA